MEDGDAIHLIAGASAPPSRHVETCFATSSSEFDLPRREGRMVELEHHRISRLAVRSRPRRWNIAGPGRGHGQLCQAMAPVDWAGLRESESEERVRLPVGFPVLVTAPGLEGAKAAKDLRWLAKPLRWPSPFASKVGMGSAGLALCACLEVPYGGWIPTPAPCR